MTAQAVQPRLRLPLTGGRSLRLVERNLAVYRRTWLILFSGFFEPLLYLVGIGFGVGSLVGSVHGQSGVSESYKVFVAPALMASSATNGAIYETTFNLFFKLKFAKLYDAVLATPMSVGDIARGEITWALLRGTVYAIGFIVVMSVLGLVVSPWGVLAVPAAVLIGFAFAAAGSLATTYVRRWQDFNIVQLVILPMFLFSGTFYPLSAYPWPLQVVIELTPLYHGVHLLRGLTTGDVSFALAVDVAYLALMGVVCLRLAARRLDILLLR
ncbi:MAG TPA: ABC transporter permease [Candidatus Dormibacteraeota bacterium]